MDWVNEIRALIDRMLSSGQSEGVSIGEVLQALFEEGECTPDMAGAIADEYADWAKAVKDLVRKRREYERTLEDRRLRYVVVVSEGGLIQDVVFFSSLDSASAKADGVAKTLDPETDDVIVWDKDEGDRVYQPLCARRKS